jgi:hypothetical protein
MNNTWNPPSEQEERILALMSEVKSLKKTKKKDVTWKKDNRPHTPKYQKEGKKAAEKPWNGKTWYYSSEKTRDKCTAFYCIHKPSQCEGKAHQFVGKEGKHKCKATKSTGQGKHKLKLAKAYKTHIKEVSNSEKDRSPGIMGIGLDK